MKTLMAILFFFLGCFHAQAIELKSAALLNKMSMTLTGKPAATADQVAVSKIQDLTEQKAFIDQKIDQYMKTADYAQKVVFNLYELFQFKNPESARYKIERYDARTYAPYSTNILFRSLAESNLSWDMILKSKNYTLTTNYVGMNSQLSNTDFGFVGSVMDLPNPGDGYANFDKYTESPLAARNIQFDEDDSRIAGALTTPPFFTRYATTGINKNRRRAAAIFRIFLCDSMSASIPAATGIDTALYDILYPKSESNVGNSAGMTENEVLAILNKDDQIHGTRADCRSCHNKLDPMGSIFTTSPASLGSMPSPGALSYNDSLGRKVNIPVNGIGEMAEALTKQDDYVRCQINHFWKWYIGVDVPMTEARMTELKQTFEKVNRRTNDFTKSLLLSKEFSVRELPNELRDLATNVKGFLQRCQSCHNTSADYSGPNLTKWPMGSNQNDPKNNNQYWISQISESLDLSHQGLNRTMPPAPQNGGFIPSKHELNMITAWIKNGAPDETGKPQQAVQP